MNPSLEPRFVLLKNAITDALREMDLHPDDSVQDIWNEQLKSWGTGYRMNRSYVLVPDEP